MFNKLSIKELVGTAIMLALISALWFGWHYLEFPEPRGQMLAPVSQLSVGDSSSQQSRALLASIDKEGFAIAFGLQFYPPPVPVVKQAPKIVASETIEAPKIKVKPVAEVKQPDTDLTKAGYRLTGIIQEDGKSAAFVYVPEDKRTVVVREQADGSVKITDIGSRWVRLSTPDGEGILELEGTDLVPAVSSARSSTSSSASTPSRPQTTDISGPSSVVELMNSRQLQTRRVRGKFGVSVNQSSPATNKIGLRRGDTILGVDNDDFKNSNDVINKLGKIGERPVRLKVQRGKDTFYINVDQGPDRESNQPPP